MVKFVNARSESIKKQLNGEIPVTAADRNGDGYTLVDGSDITLSNMGTFMGGKDGPEEMQDQNSGGMEPPDGMQGQNQGGMKSPEGMQGQNPERMQPPDGISFPGMDAGANKEEQKQAMIILGISITVLLVAFLFIRLYKRRKYTAK